MVINPACSCVDATGLVHLDGLRNWTHVRQSSGTRSQVLPGGEEAPGRSWKLQQVDLELQQVLELQLTVAVCTSCQGSSSLLLLVSEMVQMFQKDTPLYSRSAVEVPGPR